MQKRVFYTPTIFFYPRWNEKQKEMGVGGEGTSKKFVKLKHQVW